MKSPTSSLASWRSSKSIRHGEILDFMIHCCRHAGPELEAMKAVALSAKKRSLSDFQAAVKTYKVQLEDDLIVSKHLDSLYSSMLEQNLCR